MPEDTWDETRIAELRRLSAVVDMAARDFASNPDFPTSAFAAERIGDATEAFYDTLGEREGVISLLDALESARRERDDFKEAFDDVMDALSVALDGYVDYAQRPSEVVYRLRDQRDEWIVSWKEECDR